jgi:hypothetical protein
MYDNLASSASMWSLPDEGDIDGFEWDDVQYELRRLDGDGFIDGNHLKRITARGIDLLEDLGGHTILASDIRERVLAALYEMDRMEGPHARTNTEGIAEALDLSTSEAGVALHYLEGSGLIDVTGAMSDRFSGIKITARGMAKHEAIEASGGRWASSTTSPSDGHEFVFGPGEEAEAARLLRDVTEVARGEVVIIDPYARAGIVSKLQHVPKGVVVKVLTGDSMAKEPYGVQLQAHPDLSMELRVLPKSDLEFHDRYIIVDGEDSWAWGHSFHDAGKTKHTVAQLRPVNRDRILAEFQQKWPKASVIV